MTAIAGERPGSPVSSAEFLAPAHEFRRLGRKGVGRRGRLARGLAGGPDGQLGVAAQDALMQFGQHRARFGALLIDQAATRLPVQAQASAGLPLRYRAVIWWATSVSSSGY